MESNPAESKFPKAGWVEQDAEAIWEAQRNAARRALAASKAAADSIAAIGITNQRETTVVWDRKTGRPVSPAIVWQCRRTAAYCRHVAAKHGAEITRLTGLVVDAYFSASKIRWILDNVADAQSRAENGDLLFGTIDSWLIWKLTGGESHVTDVSNASRTMLMNLSAGDWDDALLKIFRIPRAMLPRIVASSGVAGMARPEHFGAEIPIAGIAGDQQAALFGQACFEPGRAKNTYGTGCFALMHSGTPAPVSRNKLLATAAASLPGRIEFAIEGSVFVAGAAVQWLRDGLGLIRTAAETEALAASVPDTAGVYLVPAFVGLGAPHWNGDARGILTGITRGAGREHIVRATLESIAYQTYELIQAMEADSGQGLLELRVDGGATANGFLMQFQADILNRPVVRPIDIETTALGAAYLAGLAAGMWKSTREIEGFWRSGRRYEPRMAEARRQELLAGWKDAVRRCLA